MGPRYPDVTFELGPTGRYPEIRIRVPPLDMSPLPESGVPQPDPDALLRHFERVRGQSVALAAPLEPEDMVVQSMPDVSPTKWHLAHVTWFFERFVLKPHAPGYREFDPAFDFLFNSYYYTAGQMHTRARRGLLSRPTVVDVLAYREHVDEALAGLIPGSDEALSIRTPVHIHHEQRVSGEFPDCVAGRKIEDADCLPIAAAA